MKCVTAQTCLWLTQSARYGLEDAQRVLLRYTVRNWRLICEQFPDSVEVLKEFPEINLRISLGIAVGAIVAGGAGATYASQPPESKSR